MTWNYVCQSNPTKTNLESKNLLRQPTGLVQKEQITFKHRELQMGLSQVATLILQGFTRLGEALWKR